MIKHKPPTNSELAQQGREGRLLRLKTENADLRNVNEGLVGTIVDLRKALFRHGEHGEDCTWHETDVCNCGLDAEINT